jgi:hypothetical protein
MKKGRRYRYYVSQTLVKGKSKSPTGPGRIPAEEIEELVLSQLASLFAICNENLGSIAASLTRHDRDSAYRKGRS